MITREQLKAHCLTKKGADASFPFGPDAEVFKVMSKMFALIPTDATSISLKCDPVLAEMLRATYACIKPAYHFNKRHWNTIYVDESIPDAEVLTMIDDSYDLVVAGLTKKDREALFAIE